MPRQSIRKHLMDKEKIFKGIACYQDQRNEIISAIESHGGKLTEKEFDATFGDYEDELLPNGDLVRHRKSENFKIWGYAPDGFILGSLMDHRDWTKYLQLTQLMCVAGILSAKKENGVIVYRLMEQEEANAKVAG